MSKTLLVLGASIYQLPVIKIANQLGYRVITTDNIPGNPGHRLADKAFTVDTTYQDGVLKLARQEGVSGIIAPGTDVAVTTVAYVASILDLPGPSLKAARILTNKFLFRDFLSNLGLSCPKFFLSKNESLDLGGVFDGSEWILKPCRSSGSKGVYIINKESEFRAFLANSQSVSLDGMVLLEEFVLGTQHSCEGIIQGGEISLALITDRDTVPPPFTATSGHRTPSRLPVGVQAKCLKAIAEVLTELNVTEGPFDCDFVATGTNISLIEITPRLGGNSLSALFESALGVDLIAYAIAHACGDALPPLTTRLPLPRAVVIFGVDRPGRIRWNEDEVATLRSEAWVDSLIFDLPRGSEVQAFTNGRNRIGEALIVGKDRDEVDARLVELKQRIALFSD